MSRTIARAPFPQSGVAPLRDYYCGCGALLTRSREPWGAVQVRCGGCGRWRWVYLGGYQRRTGEALRAGDGD